MVGKGAKVQKQSKLLLLRYQIPMLKIKIKINIRQESQFVFATVGVASPPKRLNTFGISTTQRSMKITCKLQFLPTLTVVDLFSASCLQPQIAAIAAAWQD